MAAERISKLSGGETAGLKPNDLIAFLIEEAQHQLINEQRRKITEIALAAYSKSKGKNKPTNKEKSDDECSNCHRKGHRAPDCYAKGGGKEGQAPWQNKGKQKEQATIAAAKDEDDEMFAFTCTSDYTDITAATPTAKPVERVLID